jgi:hypothetical protein
MDPTSSFRWRNDSDRRITEGNSSDLRLQVGSITAGYIPTDTGTFIGTALDGPIAMADQCQAPGCTDDAQYSEPMRHADGRLRSCKRHVEPTKDGIYRV